MISAVKIEKSSDDELTITWNTGKQSIFSFKKLRDLCPCASCSGETVLLKSWKPTKVFLETPGRYTLTAIHPVGNYALTLVWGDGHNTGIYSWDYLIRMASLPGHDHHHD